MNPVKIPETVDEYISAFPGDIQKKLQQLRESVNTVAPDATEKISYRMPSYTYYGILVYYAAFRNHIGFYPFSSAIEAFREELSGYSCSKGTIQFPHDKPLPIKLIRNILRFRVKENIHKAEAKALKKRVK